MKENKKDNKIKVIALLGGSFNPPHEGHFEMAKYIADTLKADEVWFLFSTNSFKNQSDYAPVEDRMQMGEILARFYPNYNFKMKDIENIIKSRATADVLKYLHKQYPDDRFIWVMGADNLVEFHKWERYEQIIETTPIAVVDRPGYTDNALASFTAVKYKNLCLSFNELRHQDKGWCLLHNPKIDMSSTEIRDKLKAGSGDFEGHFKDVYEYIRDKKLYGLAN